MTKNVFVVGMNTLNAERLARLRGVEDVVFHPLLTSEAVSDTQEFDIPDAGRGRGDARRV